MATVTTPDVDEALISRIKALAEAHNHPIEAEIRDLLRQAVAARPKSDFLIAIANAIAALTPKDLAQTDFVRTPRRG
jgi:plasmid stability protein